MITCLGPAASWHYQISESVTVFSLTYHPPMAFKYIKGKEQITVVVSLTVNNPNFSARC